MANTYGDKAFKIAKMSSLTGKRWPVVGKRLHEEFPYLEAEVKRFSSQRLWQEPVKADKQVLKESHS